MARPPRGLDEHGGEHEQQIGDVDVGAHAVGEDGHAREQDQRRDDPGGAPEPQLGEPVEDARAAGQREQAERDRDVLDRARGQRREHDPERLDQRVRRGGDRDFVGRRLPARELPAPGERVQRVVVGEADAADQPQRGGADGDRREGAETARAALDPGSHERARYPPGRGACGAGGRG